MCRLLRRASRRRQLFDVKEREGVQMEWLIEEPFAWTAGVGILFVCVSQENSYHTYQRYLFMLQWPMFVGCEL